MADGRTRGGRGGRGRAQIQGRQSGSSGVRGVEKGTVRRDRGQGGGPGRGRGRSERGRGGRGRGRGRGRNQQPPSKEDLDKQLDAFLLQDEESKARVLEARQRDLDDQIDAYFAGKDGEEPEADANADGAKGT